MAVWNLFLPEEQGESKTMTIRLRGDVSHLRAVIFHLDLDHSSLMNRDADLGRPPNPTRKELDELRRAAELPRPETKLLQNGEFKTVLPPQGLALIEFRR
jgi:hypothetical protein